MNKSALEQRLKHLESHLNRENPVLLDAVKSFRVLDKVAHGLGVLERDQSFATQVPWWPMISILGTYSAGKSTFVNNYVGQKLQMSGNQAVDDKFTVICYSSDKTDRVLPGLALDADTRFPFYQISAAIDEVAEGEGKRVDSYLQLKACPSEKLRGKILIDSPGFDADEQRTSTLRITKHIVDLSDLVLVFFDARHPEPGAMQDTLRHLVAETIERSDASKFLYILNQIDNTAREDNPEEVFAAWQRALAQKGLTAGRFYRIYDPESAIPIENEKTRERFEAKRAVDVAEIYGRMEQVEVERAYRIIGMLENTAKTIENEMVPRIRAARDAWRRRVFWLDGIALGLVAAAFAWWSVSAGHWNGLLSYAPPWKDKVLGDPVLLGLVLGGVALVAIGIHVLVCKLSAKMVASKLRRASAVDDNVRESVAQGFLKNTRPWQAFLGGTPSGWGAIARGRIAKVLRDVDRFVQDLNDRFTNPSGHADQSGAPQAATAVSETTGPRVSAAEEKVKAVAMDG